MTNQRSIWKPVLGIIRDKNNPYIWINAYTQEEIKFEFWSNTIDFIKPAACLDTSNDGHWKTDDGCSAFCVEPLPDVLEIISENELNVCDYNDCAQGAQCIPEKSVKGIVDNIFVAKIFVNIIKVINVNANQSLSMVPKSNQPLMVTFVLWL